MQLFLVSALVIFNLVLGAAVWLNNRKRPVNVVFSLFVLGVVGWTISNYFADHVREFSGALFWVRASFAFAGLLSAFLLIFAYLFARPAADPIKTSFFWVIGALAAAMFLFCFTPYVVRTVELRSWGANTINGPLFFVWLAYFLANVVSAGRKLVVRYLSAKGQQRQQIQYLFFGVALSFTFGATISLFIPLITGSTELAKYSPFGAAFLIFFTAMAMIRHRLLGIRLLVLKSVAYSVTLGLVVAGYVAVTYLIFQALRLAVSETLVNIAAFFVLVFTFNPVRLFIERYTDRLFFKNRYNFNDLLEEITNITKKQSRSIDALTNSLLATITGRMRLAGAAFVLTMSSQVAHVRSAGFERQPHAVWGRLMRLAIESGGIGLIDDFDDASPQKGLMRRHGIEVFVPIRTDEGTIAALFLGEKKSGDSFNDEDVRLLGLIAPPIALALENAASFIERGQRIAELKSINKMFRHIEHFLDLDKLLQEIVDEAITVINADGGSLMLTQDSGASLSIKTSRNLHPVISLNTRIKAGEGIAGRVAETQKPIIINGFKREMAGPDLKREDVSSAISVPMIVEDRLIGVLNIHRRKDRPEFTEENLNIMNAFAAQAAEAIVKAGHYREIEKLSLQNDRQFREFIKALSKTVDAKDPYTYGHSEEVTHLCLEVAEAMGLDERQTRSIEIGSRLHDMGKIGIPEAILNKKGKLSPEELRTVQRHPEIAADILKDTESLKDIRDLILYHHEHWDGSGYPAGLKGQEIPLGSRILAVSDAYDAMISRRAYREPLPRDAAAAELRRNAGRQFDPLIVDLFLRIISAHALKPVKRSIYRRGRFADISLNKIKKKAA